MARLPLTHTHTLLRETAAHPDAPSCLKPRCNFKHVTEHTGFVFLVLFVIVSLLEPFPHLSKITNLKETDFDCTTNQNKYLLIRE